MRNKCISLFLQDVRGRTGPHRSIQCSTRGRQADPMNQGHFKSISEQLQNLVTAVSQGHFPGSHPVPLNTHTLLKMQPALSTPAQGYVPSDHSCRTPEVAQMFLESHAHPWLLHPPSHPTLISSSPFQVYYEKPT